VAAICLFGVLPAAQAAEQHHDHAAMTATQRDELGRRLHGAKHEINDAMGDELRARIGVWKNFTNAQIALSMNQMGSNYEWYISDPDMKGEQGLLILVHGFRDRGDRVFKETVQPMSELFPTAIAFGMSMMTSQHIQLGLDDLVAVGAKEIVVIPGVATSHSEMIRQWEYIFGLRDKAEYASVPRVKTEAKIHFLSPPNDDPLIAEILLDHAAELSTNPANELVIIASHGPTYPEDNKNALKVLANLAKIVQEDGGFSEVIGVTLQDDAAPAIRAANVARIRGKVEEATAAGKGVIVVTNLMSTRGIQAKLRKDLQGLDYKFNKKSISQHDNFLVWMGSSIDAALKSGD